MKEAIVSVVAIAGLVVLGWHLLDVNPQATKEAYAVAVVIGGIAGFYLPRAVTLALLTRKLKNIKARRRL